MELKPTLISILGNAIKLMEVKLLFQSFTQRLQKDPDSYRDAKDAKDVKV